MKTIEPRFTYRRHEKLKSRKQAEALFSRGKSVQLFPLKLFYLSDPGGVPGVRAGVGASKRFFKKAVHRNRIKRLLREAYRLEKAGWLQQEPLHHASLALFILYTGKELPALAPLREKMRQALALLVKRLHGA